MAKPLVIEAIDQDLPRDQGLQMLFYRTALPLSRQTLTYVAGIIGRHRAAIGSLRRKLKPGQQALLVLAYLREGDPFAEIAAGPLPLPAMARAIVTAIIGGSALPSSVERFVERMSVIGLIPPRAAGRRRCRRSRR
jgi:hypothetical protein